MSLVTTIRERFAGRQADAESQYAKLVSDSAAGRDSDPATLAIVLTATGRTMEQFIGDVERIERRAAARLKLAEAEKLKPACEAASKESLSASVGVDAAREQARKIVNDALEIFRQKSDTAGSLSRQIRELEMAASEDLMATSDRTLQGEIDQLEARIRDIRIRQNSVGRSAGCDPDEVAMAHRKFNDETATLEGRIEELRVLQVA